MGIDKLKNTLNKAKNQPEYFIKGVSPESVIDKAESLLGIKLSEQHRYFYLEIGYLSFNGNEIYGICKNDFSGTSVICAIETTLKQRKKEKLPHNWVLFTDLGNKLGYLDYSDLNKNGEPPVIMVNYDGKSQNKIDVISQDIASFIESLIE